MSGTTYSDTLSHCSPSSGGNASNHGTPGTKMTDFSPEDVRSESKSTTNDGTNANQPPPFALQVKSADEVDEFSLTGETQDPFIGNTHGLGFKAEPSVQKLSPTAPTFKPLHSQGTNDVSSSKGMAPWTQAFHTANIGSGYLPDVSSHMRVIKKPWSPIMKPNSDKYVAFVTPRENSPTDSLFSNPGKPTRYLKISNVLRTASVDELNDAFNEPTFIIPKLVVITEQASNGVIQVKFSDIRDAENAVAAFRQTQPGWIIEYVDAKEFMRGLSFEESKHTLDYEGQILVTAKRTGLAKNCETAAVSKLVINLMGTQGEVLAWETVSTIGQMVAIRVEFYDSAIVEEALKLDGLNIRGIHLTIVRFKPDLVKESRENPQAPEPLIIGQDDDDVGDLFGRMSLNSNKRNSGSSIVTNPSIIETPSRPSQNQYAQPGIQDNCSPSPNGFASNGYTTHKDWAPGPFRFNPQGTYPVPMPTFPWPELGNGQMTPDQLASRIPCHRNGMLSTPTRVIPRNAGRRVHEYPSGHHNVVDTNRIRQGLDVRTTTKIMLRNIPNKIDQAMLKGIVDETSLGKYDFMYLRIDFANNCNVGYAFINFEDPFHIVDFVEARAGKRWGCFNSDKVAEVSYATIQGKDCLVQKFRNSSVMLEHASFRPKIFHTGTGPLAGKEDIFPGPDNPSKMRRSVENAEHVGLFAPRAGQHFRDEQRRRRSQYDRGTRLAEMEDFYAAGDPGFQAHTGRQTRGMVYPTYPGLLHPALRGH